jgi:hypothetical protein
MTTGPRGDSIIISYGAPIHSLDSTLRWTAIATSSIALATVFIPLNKVDTSGNPYRVIAGRTITRPMKGAVGLAFAGVGLACTVARSYTGY